MPGGLLAFSRGLPATPPRTPTSSVINEGFPREQRRSSMDQIKRASIGGIVDLTNKKKKKVMSPTASEKQPASIELLVESPPLTLYGSRHESTGTLFSGQIRLRVTENTVAIAEWHASLFVEYSVKKPVHKDCPDCKTKREELKRWELVKDPKTFPRGEHNRPINHLLKGDLPATTHGHLGSIEYRFCSIARTAAGEIVKFEKVVPLWRALQPFEESHRSLRIFPPTKLELELEFPKIIHVDATFPLHLRLNHLVVVRENNYVRWRVRKCRWQIFEESKVVGPACEKHANKPGENRSIVHTDSREVSNGEILEKRWKCDFSTGDGAMETEIVAYLNSVHRPSCDVENGAGFTIEHKLHLELVIQEEFAPNKRPDQVIPTGNARVLKAKYQLLVTSRRGLGVAWDEEQPPMYDDVPPSPPTYSNMEDYDFSQLENDTTELVG